MSLLQLCHTRACPELPCYLGCVQCAYTGVNQTWKPWVLVMLCIMHRAASMG